MNLQQVKIMCVMPKDMRDEIITSRLDGSLPDMVYNMIIKIDEIIMKGVSLRQK